MSSFGALGAAGQFGAQTTRVFYSGMKAAQAAKYARSIGGQTLGMTLKGKILTIATKVVDQGRMMSAWEKASLEFAENAEGSVRSYGDKAGRVFSTIERPALQSNPYVTAIVHVLP